MWVRKRIDIRWRDLLSAAIWSLWPVNRRAAEARCGLFPESGSLPTLSVRSGFDLFLQAAAFPPGAEILRSAITIADMAAIAEAHGLVVVPVDLEPDGMSVTAEAVRRRITPRTCALVVAHLFGAVMPLDEVLAVAGDAGLVVFEDCAQAFDGVRYPGHPESDVVAFSFGPIKTATALGGGVLAVRNPESRDCMRRLQAVYPAQSRWLFLRRVVQYAVLKMLGTRFLFRGLLMYFRMRDRDPDVALNQSVRNFAGADLLSCLRQRPATALLCLLHRRIVEFDANRQDRRAWLGRVLADELAGRFLIPGAGAALHTFWVFPVVADIPADVVRVARAAGFDATSSNQLRVVGSPSAAEELAPVASSLLRGIVFLPLYPEMPEREVRRMGRTLAAIGAPRGFGGAAASDGDVAKEFEDV